MTILAEIATGAAELTAWRRHLHTIPELDFDLFETSDFVAERLEAIGVDEIHRGIARTGIVALIRGRAPGAVVGLRADMDALPITEETGAPWASRRAGRMHACGHDGHTTILLGAARHLARTRTFAGTVALIFQPSEEMSGGGRVMVEEGMMERFGISRVFGLHNVPNLAFGHVATRPGSLLAAADEFRITLRGRGGHAAYPDEALDPVPGLLELGMALRQLTARRIDARDPAVLGLTVLEASRATNVIPETARLAGTVRTLSTRARDLLEEEVRRLAGGIAAAHGLSAEIDYQRGYPVTVNDPGSAALVARVAEGLFGAGNVTADCPPELGSEDFSYMLEARPGAFFFLGTGPGAGLHSPRFDFNDEAIPHGAALFVALAEAALAT